MEAQVAFLQAMSLPIALVAMVNQLAPIPLIALCGYSV